MKRLFEFFILAALMCMCGNAWADTIRIVVYGDSILSGYELDPEQSFSARLDQKLRAAGFLNVRVANMSESGETSGQALERVNSVASQRPDIVILELGTNDAKSGIAINIVFNNIARIIQKLVGQQCYVILIGNHTMGNMGDGYERQFEDIYTSLASSYKLALYPFVLDGIVGHQDMTLADGYHPNAKGIQLITDQVYSMVDTAVRYKMEYHEWEHQNQSAAPLPPGTVQ